jgi:FkbM family methyltransferase
MVSMHGFFRSGPLRDASVSIASFIVRLLPVALQHRLRLLAKRLGREDAELALVRLLARPDRTFLDVGANRGGYLEAGIGRFAAVYAVEPNPQLAAYLRSVFGSRVTVLNLALSDRTGTLPFYLPVRAGRAITGRGSLEADANPGFVQTSFEVAVHRLDDLDLPSLGLVKIDVEGHERAVLAGGRTRLARDRPALLVEIEERHHPGGSEAVVDLLAACGYEPFYLAQDRLRPLAGSTIAALQAPELAGAVAAGRHVAGYVNNFLFLHRDDAAARSALREAGLLDRPRLAERP